MPHTSNLQPGFMVVHGNRLDELRSLVVGWMRRNPLFWFCLVLIAVFVVMAAFPILFTRADPGFCDLSTARQGPSGAHPFGTDTVGRDVFVRTWLGGRNDLMMVVLVVVASSIIGTLVGRLYSRISRIRKISIA